MPVTDDFHFYTGDYGARLDRLESAARAALNDKTPLTAIEVHPYDSLRAEYDDLKAEAEAEGTHIVLTAVGRKVWRSLKEKHPPRSGEGVDPELAKQHRLAGVDTDSVEDDLVHATLTTPTFSSRGAFDEWADTLSEGEWQSLVNRSWALANGARIGGPKGSSGLPTRSDD